MKRLTSSPAVIIFTLLLLSVAIRWNAFEKPYQGSHVWLSTHILITSQIWQSEGITTYGFNPIYSFPTDTDRNKRSLASGLSDTEGNYYYVSYPPFSFYLAHFYFTIFSAKPNIIGLYVFNIVLHSFICILLYILICRVYNVNVRDTLYTPALLASSLYLFSTQTLWCHVYMYFADSLIQLLWVTYLLLSFMIFRRNQIYNWLALGLFCIINFLLIYTEWLGLFVSSTLFIYAIYKSTRDLIYLRAVLIISITIILGLAITVYQFSLIDGLTALVDTSVSKYTDRNGYAYEGLHLTKIHFLRLVSHYWRYPKANIILIIGFLSIYLISKKKIDGINKDHAFLLSLTSIPILLHHSVFLEFSSLHDFSTLKASVLFSLLIPFLYNSINFNEDKIITSIDKKKILLYFFAAMITLNIILFFSLSTSSSLHQKANIISNTSKQEQSLFAITKGDQTNGIMVFMGKERGFSTQIQLLTQRNILAVEERNDVINHLKEFKNSEAKIYFFDFYGNMVGIETINLNLLTATTQFP